LNLFRNIQKTQYIPTLSSSFLYDMDSLTSFQDAKTFLSAVDTFAYPEMSPFIPECFSGAANRYGYDWT
jgi:hypothetical protein